MKSRYLQQGMYAAVFTVAAVQANAAVDFQISLNKLVRLW